MLETHEEMDSAPRGERLTDGEVEARPQSGAQLRFDISRDQYDRLDRVNWSRLKLMLRSPAHYRDSLTTKRADTDAMKLGRAVHLAALEPQRFQSACVLWDEGVRHGKKWEKFADAHADQEILTEREYDLCGRIAAAVRGNPDAMKYLSNARTEATVLWSATGPSSDALPGWAFDLKSRLDSLAIAADAIADLKTTRDASLNGFGREVIRLRYLGQAAFYSDAVTAATGRVLPYKFVVVETAPPHCVSVFHVTEEQIAEGRRMYRDCLERLGFCVRENRWPGYAEGEQELALPEWALPSSNDEDVSEMGLVIGD